MGKVDQKTDSPSIRRGVDRVVRELGRILRQSQDELTRVRVIRALGALGPASAPLVPALIELAGPKPGALSDCAVEALGDIGPAAVAAVPVLSKVMLSRRNFIGSTQWSAAISLGRIGSELAIEPLVRAIHSREEQGPSIYAIGALLRLAARGKSRAGPAGVLESEPSLSKLARISSNTASFRRLGSDPMPRRMPARDFRHGLLGKGTVAALPRLEKLAKDKTYEWRSDLRELIRKIREYYVE